MVESALCIEKAQQCNGKKNWPKAFVDSSGTKNGNLNDKFLFLVFGEENGRHFLAIFLVSLSVKK